MAAVVEDRPRSVLLDRCLASYTSIIESAMYTVPLSSFLYGILSKFDLPDLVGALSPRPCWLLNATGPTELALPQSQVMNWYEPARQAYARSGRHNGLRTLVQPEEASSKIILAWSQET